MVAGGIGDSSLGGGIAGSSVPAGLRSAIEARYRLRLGAARELTDGDECRVWRVTSDRGPIVVRLSPAWRTREEFAFGHDLARFARQRVPEVAAPIAAADASPSLMFEIRPVALFPFVAGVPLDRERADLRLAAARLLARLHRVTLTWPDSRSPARRADASSDPPAIPGTTRLHEPSLSAWHEGLYRMAGGLTEGPIHGDYYRRNVLCADGSIVGVIDWDESRYDFLMQKVARSAWEIGKTPSGDDLLLDRARAFPRANAEAGGPCAESEYAHVLPLIRWRLWKEVRSQLTAIARGEQVDRDYLESELRAFRRVRDIPASELDVTRAGSA